MGSFREFLKRHHKDILLFLGIFLAFYVRFLHTSKGLPYLYNWDEPQTASTALNIMKTGDFNPHFFHYGSLMIYLNLILDIFCFLFFVSKPAFKLTGLGDIKTFLDTGWHWTISHPQFYHCNRVLTVVIATLLIYFLYRLTLLVTKDKWISLIALFFIATLQVHINYSVWVTNDVPLSFFTLMVIFFSSLFVEKKETKYFYISLIFVGLSSATKYNGVLVILIPVISLAWIYFKDRKLVKSYMLPLIFLIPSVTFLMVMPYSILDLNHFLNDVAFEIRNYKVLGPYATVTPGIPHFILQMKNFYHYLGVIPVILIFIGMIAFFEKKNSLLRFVFIYPVVYIYFMCNTRQSFQRNFVIIYPFFAMLFGMGIYYIYIFLKKIIKKEGLSRILVVSLTLSILLTQSISALVLAESVHNFRDSRTRLIDILNGMSGYDMVLIAKELRVHKLDLCRLKREYRVVSMLKMGGAKFKGKKVIYVMPDDMIAFHPDRCYDKLISCRKVIGLIKSDTVIKHISGYPARLDIYSIDPGIFILKRFPLKY